MFIKKKKGKIVLWLMTGAVVITASAATTEAYLTRATQSLQNSFVSGNAGVEVQEPDWKDKSGDSMLPGEKRKKNPLVKNTGTLDAWIFLEVKIPIYNVELVDERTNRKQPKAEVELFQFQKNDGWELMEKNRKGNVMCYVYGWKEPVKPLQQTGTLFDNLTMASYLEGSLNIQEVHQVVVTARAIQKNIAPAGTGLKQLYQIYLNNQN